MRGFGQLVQERGELVEPRRDGLGAWAARVSAAHGGALLVRSRVALRRSARNALRASNAAYFACINSLAAQMLRPTEPVLANEVGGPPAYRRSFYAVLGPD